jgi:hypothetical protein
VDEGVLLGWGGGGGAGEFSGDDVLMRVKTDVGSGR